MSQPGGGRIAWEDETVGFPRNLGRSWWQSLARPMQFFRRVDPDAPFARALLYYLIVTVIAAWFEMLWALSVPGGTYAAVAAELGVAERTLVVLSFFLSPFYGLLALGVGAAVVHLFVILMVPDRRSIGATARVVCYSIGPAVLTAVPYVGALAGSIWTLVLLTVGVRVVHRTTAGRAAAIVLIPWAISIVLLIAVALVGVALMRLDPRLLP